MLHLLPLQMWLVCAAQVSVLAKEAVAAATSTLIAACSQAPVPPAEDLALAFSRGLLLPPAVSGPDTHSLQRAGGDDSAGAAPGSDTRSLRSA